MGKVGMDNNSVVNKKEVEKIIKTLSSATKPSPALLYFCSSLLSLLAMLVAINMHADSILKSFVTFITCFLITSAGLIFFYSYINKVSILSGLYVTKNLIDQMSVNEWDYPFPTRNIHPLILIHPVFRVIAGLYLCRVNYLAEGLGIIDKAVTESPAMIICVSHGKITDVVKFKALTNIIANDLMPGKTFKIALEIIIALYWFLFLIISMALIFAVTYDLISGKQ